MGFVCLCYIVVCKAVRTGGDCQVVPFCFNLICSDCAAVSYGLTICIEMAVGCGIYRGFAVCNGMIRCGDCFRLGRLCSSGERRGKRGEGGTKLLCSILFFSVL